MPSVLVQFDKKTYRALNRAAPPAKRKRAEFIREAVKEALLKQEYEKMREAYLKQPDRYEGDDWTNWEEFRP